MKKYEETAELRFWKKVLIGDDCWVWTAGKDWDGYGEFSIKHRPIKAHQFSWIVTNGSIPKGLFICHHCDNPSCVRPDHLFLGTAKDNYQDSVVKGRASHHGANRKNICIHGHAFTKENTHINPNGHQICRTCKREEMRKRRQLQRQTIIVAKEMTL